MYLSKHDVAESDLSEVAVRDGFVGIERQIAATIRLKSCKGSLYMEFSPSCRIVKDYTRGDCEIAGVDGY